MKRLLLAAALPLALVPMALLGGCDNSPTPPGDTGVCYQFISPKSGKPHFNVLTRNVPNLETCAANLEAMRIHFITLGSTNTDIVGAYQSKFLFLQSEGVFSSDTLNGPAYLALVRTGDGRLAMPGAVQQPAN